MATKTGIYAWALMTNHAHILLRNGMALAEAARQLGVSTSAISKIIKRAD